MYRVHRPFIRKNILWSMETAVLKFSARVRLRIVRAQILKMEFYDRYETYTTASLSSFQTLGKV